MMKITGIKYLSLLVVVFVVGLAALSCRQSPMPSSPVNNDLINYRSFFVSAESVDLDTFTRGTIFVRGDKEKPEERRVQISAWVEIDAADWGGVSFSIPQGWKVTHIASDYPRGNPEPETYTGILQTESEHVQYHRIVEVGCTRHGAAEPQGGKGNLIIELAPESPEQELPENLEILIGAGSEDDYILNPVHETFEVPLNIDYSADGGS
jgi:hypothetical protein